MHYGCTMGEGEEMLSAGYLHIFYEVSSCKSRLISSTNLNCPASFVLKTATSFQINFQGKDDRRIEHVDPQNMTSLN